MVFLPPPSPEGWESESDEEEDGVADQDPLNINWIVLRGYQVGICSLPGNRLGGARRSLPADIETLKTAGVQDVFVLCTSAELGWSRVHTLLSDYEERGLVPHHHPLSENEIPSKQQCVVLLRELWSAIHKRRRAVVHCVDGNGRASLVLSLLAMILDASLLPVGAIELVQQARGPAAIQTVKQYNFIMGFHQQAPYYRASILPIEI